MREMYGEKMKIWKRFINMFMCIMICAQMCVVNIYAEETQNEPEELYARSAVLMDADSGRILFQKDGENVMPMASTTKIMTCILTLENMEDGQTGMASDYAVSQPKVHLGVRSKEEFYLEDLLYSLMLESHNDSAVIIAETIGGTVEGFAALMNEKAKGLGGNDTYFITPNGLDAEDENGIHSTTAADLARIMKYCIMDSPEKDEFLKITQTKSYQFSDVKGERSFSCTNHNAFLDMMEGAFSGKTGFTANAGYCYVGALERDGKTFIVALLACGWPNNKTYKWKDTRKLMEYGLNNYEYRNVWEEVKSKNVLVENGVDKANPYNSEVYIHTKVANEDKELSILLKKSEKVEIQVEQDEKIEAPVAKNEKIGTVTYFLDGKMLKQYDVVTVNAIKEKDLLWCINMLSREYLL